jgi:DNA-binding MarR family transcriptional regulator
MREVWRSVTELFFSAEHQARFAGAAVELGLTPPMLRALLDLEPGHAEPMRELASQWQCDPSFVTVVVDGLEAPGFVERRVAPHDRRVKTVQLTAAGVAARERALDAVYAAPTAFWELRPAEQDTLARLLRKLADAQAVYDELIVGHDGGHCGLPGAPGGEGTGPAPGRSPPGGAGRRSQAGGRTRLGPVRRGMGGGTRGHGGGARQRSLGGRPGGADRPGDAEDAPTTDAGWRAHFEAHQEELRSLRDELARIRDEVRAQARRPVDEFKAAKADVKAGVKAVKADVKAEAKAVKADVKAELLAAADDANAHLKGNRRRR